MLRNYEPLSVRDLLDRYNLTIAEASRVLMIPYRTLQNWVYGERMAPEYLRRLVHFFLAHRVDK